MEGSSRVRDRREGESCEGDSKRGYERPQSIDLNDMISSKSSSLSASREMSSFWTVVGEGSRRARPVSAATKVSKPRVLTVKVKEVRLERRGDRLVFRVVVSFEVRMLERLFDRHARLWVDCGRQKSMSARADSRDAKPARTFGDVQVSVRCRKSHACGEAFGKSCANGFFLRKGSARM
jgi:hypothetical protein